MLYITAIEVYTGGRISYFLCSYYALIGLNHNKIDINQGKLRTTFKMKQRIILLTKICDRHVFKDQLTLIIHYEKANLIIPRAGVGVQRLLIRNVQILIIINNLIFLPRIGAILTTTLATTCNQSVLSI